MMLILDDHPLVRQGLCSIIRMQRGDEKIWEANNIGESIKILKEQDVKIVFVDLRLRNEDGFELLRWLRKNQKPVKKFIITSSSLQSDFNYALELDVDAYLLKDVFLDEILYSLLVVERGGKFYSAELLQHLNQPPEEEKRLAALSNRELEVLELLNQGLTNAAIGKHLFIAESTVKKHISSVLSKLELQHRIEAAVFANKNSQLLKRMRQRRNADVKGDEADEKKVPS